MLWLALLLGCVWCFVCMALAFAIGPVMAIVIWAVGTGALVAMISSASNKADAAKAEAASSKTCPQCAETVKAAALKCKHCGTDLAAA
jgi:membrane protease subunit (stomatin/prohibitin family)